MLTKIDICDALKATDDLAEQAAELIYQLHTLAGVKAHDDIIKYIKVLLKDLREAVLLTSNNIKAINRIKEAVHNGKNN